ncbi:uncharacterized protein J3D65DRAFT_339384 [Phyllosticta citribraziliensis]|uniref:Uncharacterized protein n=1 Tax=Phyllosticta citribraziliensis TaxID=989973 RepID=A0ABR1LX37_9PEZI
MIVPAKVPQTNIMAASLTAHDPVPGHEPLHSPESSITLSRHTIHARTAYSFIVPQNTHHIPITPGTLPSLRYRPTIDKPSDRRLSTGALSLSIHILKGNSSSMCYFLVSGCPDCGFNEGPYLQPCKHSTRIFPALITPSSQQHSSTNTGHSYIATDKTYPPTSESSSPRPGTGSSTTSCVRSTLPTEVSPCKPEALQVCSSQVSSVQAFAWTKHFSPKPQSEATTSSVRPVKRLPLDPEGPKFNPCQPLHPAPSQISLTEFVTPCQPRSTLAVLGRTYGNGCPKCGTTSTKGKVRRGSEGEADVERNSKRRRVSSGNLVETTEANREMGKSWGRLAEAQRRIDLWLQASNDQYRKEMFSLGLVHYLEMCLEEVDEIEEEEDRYMLAHGETEEEEEKRMQRRAECRFIVSNTVLRIWHKERQEEYELLSPGKRRTETLLVSHVVDKLRNSDSVSMWFPSLLEQGHIPWTLEVDERNDSSARASEHGALRGGASNNNQSPQIGGLDFPNWSWPDFGEADPNDAEKEARKDSSRPENEKNGSKKVDVGTQTHEGSSSTAGPKGKEGIHAASEAID